MSRQRKQAKKVSEIADVRSRAKSRKLVTLTSEQPAGLIRFRKRAAPLVIVLGLVFLGTTGVQFVVDGDSRGEVGFVLGILLVGVGIQQWIRLRSVERSR